MPAGLTSRPVDPERAMGSLRGDGRLDRGAGEQVTPTPQAWEGALSPLPGLGFLHVAPLSPEWAPRVETSLVTMAESSTIVFGPGTGDPQAFIS